VARRATKGSGLEGLLLLAFFAVVFFVVPAVLTVAVYGGLFCILIGLIFCQINGKAPVVKSANVFSSTLEEDALASFRTHQNNYITARHSCTPKGIGLA
jgi:hypothetical protein